MPHGTPTFRWKLPQRDDPENAQLLRESLQEQQTINHPDPLDPEHPEKEAE